MDLLKILYPDRCPICDAGRPIMETGICKACSKKLEPVGTTVCHKCGRRLEDCYSEFKLDKMYRKSPDYVLCPLCEVKKTYYDGGRCVFAYSSIAGSIYKFKYMNRLPYAKGYAELMIKEIGPWLRKLKPDAFIPVPLHKKRLIKRGYNQATELAIELSRLTGIPVRDNCIVRKKNTIPQKLMGRKGRNSNMKKAFIVIENVVNLRRVVIIDDIFTTGSTVDSMAKELKKSGIEEVWFLTLARAGI